MLRSYFSMGILVSILLLKNSFTEFQPILVASTPLSPNYVEQAKSMSQTNPLPPAVANAVRQELSRRTNIPPDKFKVVKATPETWPDGCLGLAQPEEFCLQMLVSGWRVTLSHSNQTWVYRTDSQGRTLRLETEQ